MTRLDIVIPFKHIFITSKEIHFVQLYQLHDYFHKMFYTYLPINKNDCLGDWCYQVTFLFARNKCKKDNDICFIASGGIKVGIFIWLSEFILKHGRNTTILIIIRKILLELLNFTLN